ncbi:MAG: carbohydrate binding family 9 domain-containing protein [Bacteroidales bacterium]|jgi:hypothetical protein|nr:carbohydrate binding family 9 domain-containing protein [Bacteroidales bacterium]
MKGIPSNLLIWLFLFSCPGAGIAGDPVKPFKTETPPVIDGILDEEFWKSSQCLSGFKSFIPDFGKELPFNTIVWLAYDEENIYFAFKCYDNEPGKIKASVDSRDKIRQDDWVCVNLDSYNDQQTLYCIYANANGIQMDTRFAAGNEDLGVDLVWYSAGRINDDGYTVEMQLPLKSIRFSNKEPVMMSAFFERYVSRTSTHVSFPELDPAKGYAFFGQMQSIQYDGVKHYALLEILPSVTYSYKGEQVEGKMTATENKPDAGLTIKYGITSQLILDAAINPDFSQVEADAGQVDANLRYQLFYPEKRPFFQEGNENFKIGSTGSSPMDPMGALVHTRNIANPIAGVKLSGKIGSKSYISILYAADRVPETDNDLYGNYSHFPVIRYKRSLRDDSYLGVLATSVINSGINNYVGGADGNLRLNKSTMLEFHSLLSSNIDGTEESNISGHALGVNILSDQRNLTYAVALKEISENFISQTGYIDRTGITIMSGSVTPKLYPASEIFRRIDIGIFTGQLRDNIYDLWETTNSLSVTNWIGGTVRTKIQYNYSTEIYQGEKFNTSGLQFTMTGTAGTRFDGTISYRRRNAIYYPESLQGYGNVFAGEIRYLPLEKLHTQLSVTFQDLYDDSDSEKIFDYLLLRGRVTWQLNRYLFLRSIVEYNDYRKSVSTDFLASFTYIPGTVFHIGYGFLSEYRTWNGMNYIEGERLTAMKRGFFVKLSYLFRL